MHMILLECFSFSMVGNVLFLDESGSCALLRGTYKQKAII